MTSTEIKKISMDLFLEIKEDIQSDGKPAIDLPKNFEELQDICDANMYLEDTYTKLYADGKRQEEIYSILNRIIDQINNLLKSN